MTDYSLFNVKAPWIMAKLLADFPFIDVDCAAAVVGNLGHECNGFKSLQEISPTVAGSKGGYGWAQWTGPRRRAYEAYCVRNSLDAKSDQANYAYLFIELKGLEGSEGRALANTMKTTGLENKTIAFEKAFLRAGVKHYDSRITYAKMALDAYEASSFLHPTPAPATAQPSIVVATQSPTIEPVVVAQTINDAVVEKKGFDISKYNKAIGATLGALVAIVVTQFPQTEKYLTPEMQSLLIGILGTVGTLLAPKNTK